MAELNAVIAEAVAQLNGRSLQKLDGSRRSCFETLDRPALQPRPRERYVYARWQQTRVNLDYHVELERCYYSPPGSSTGRKP